jgi:hypothetical protein
MADRVVEVIESPDGLQRVLIVQRPDNLYSYRSQFRAGEGRIDDPNRYIGTYASAEEPGWEPPGPYCGIYDSAATAKWEALGKIDWVASTQRAH